MFSIRRAGREDAALLARLRVVFVREVGSVQADDEAAFEKACERYFAGKLGTDDLAVWLAESGGDVVGVAALVVYDPLPFQKHPEARHGYVQNVWVAPDWRRRGVARALMDAVVAHCDAAGLGRVWLRATEAGEPLYGSLGFVERPRYMHRDLETGPA